MKSWTLLKLVIYFHTLLSSARCGMFLTHKEKERSISGRVTVDANTGAMNHKRTTCTLPFSFNIIWYEAISTKCLFLPRIWPHNHVTFFDSVLWASLYRVWKWLWNAQCNHWKITNGKTHLKFTEKQTKQNKWISFKVFFRFKYFTWATALSWDKRIPKL